MITIADKLRPTSDVPLQELSDELLLQQYAKTMLDAPYTELVRRYQAELYDYLKRYSGDAELAEDALQGTWLQLHLKCHTFESGRRVRPWLYTIAVNQVIDAMRSQRRHQMLSIDQQFGEMTSEQVRLSDCLRSSEETSLANLERRETLSGVRQAVQRLPVHQKDLVNLIFFHGFKYHEAAAALSIPEGTAKSRMHAAFRNLQPELCDMTS